jgi:hypothetical protein
VKFFLAIISVAFFSSLLVVSNAYCAGAGTDNLYTTILSSMSIKTDIIGKDFDNNKFIIYGDAKAFENGQITDEHLSEEMNGIIISIKSSEFQTEKLDPSSFFCEYFHTLALADDEDDDMACDTNTTSCDYFRCLVDKSFENEVLTIVVIKSYTHKKDLDDMDLNEDGDPDGLVDWLTTQHSRPSDEINLNCNNFNSCEDSGVLVNPDPNSEDTDEDGVLNTVDNCPDVKNADQRDSDSDGFGDVCDNCVEFRNLDQTSDEKDLCFDYDEDGIPAFSDKCEGVYDTTNSSQRCIDFYNGVIPQTDSNSKKGCSLIAGGTASATSYLPLLIGLVLIGIRRRKRD